MDLLIGHNHLIDMENDEDELGPMVDPLLLIQINDDERFSDDDLFQPHNFLGNSGDPADVLMKNDDLLDLDSKPNKDWDESLVITDSDTCELTLFDLDFPFRDKNLNASFQDENKTEIDFSFQDENQTKINLFISGREDDKCRTYNY